MTVFVFPWHLSIAIAQHSANGSYNRHSWLLSLVALEVVSTGATARTRRTWDPRTTLARFTFPIAR